MNSFKLKFSDDHADKKTFVNDSIVIRTIEDGINLSEFPDFIKSLSNNIEIVQNIFHLMRKTFIVLEADLEKSKIIISSPLLVKFALEQRDNLESVSSPKAF
jgi:hypothetical protein